MSEPQPTDVYFTFAGMIDQQAVSRIFNAFDLAVTNGIQTVHLLIQSGGGMVDDGIAVYNYLTNLPVTLITYNEGSVQSIAVVMYLAGKIRKCADNANFLIHKTTFNFPTAATAAMMRGTAESAEQCDKRTDDILKSHIKMPNEKWAARDRFDLTISADEGKQYGLVHEIAHFHPPKGSQIYNIL